MTEFLAHTIEQTKKKTGLGRTKLYELIGEKKLDARKYGSRTLITDESLRGYIANLPVANICITRKLPVEIETADLVETAPTGATGELVNDLATRMIPTSPPSKRSRLPSKIQRPRRGTTAIKG